MIYLVCYDIAFDEEQDKAAMKRLHQVAKTMEQYSMRRQKSFFEGILTDVQLTELLERLGAIIESSKDSIRFYPLCEKCLKNTIVQGTGEVLEIKEYLLL